MKVLYVVAIDENEAEKLAEFTGCETRDEAQTFLSKVQATWPKATNRLTIFEVTP